MDRQLDEFLRLRKIPAAPEGLAERIIAEALRQKAVRRFSFGEFWAIFTEEFILPHPAFVLAALLLLGASAGFTTQLQSYVFGDNGDALTAYSAVDSSVEDGVIL